MRDFGSDYADSIDYVESHYKSKYSFDNDFSEYKIRSSFLIIAIVLWKDDPIEEQKKLKQV